MQEGKADSSVLRVFQAVLTVVDGECHHLWHILVITFSQADFIIVTLFSRMFQYHSAKCSLVHMIGVRLLISAPVEEDTYLCCLSMRAASRVVILLKGL